MQKEKSICKNLNEYIKSIINDKGKFSLSKSLILIGILSLITVIIQLLVQGLCFVQLYPPVLLLNALPIFLVMCLLYFVFGKISCSYVITNLIVSVLLMINHYKIKFRDEPLNVTDISVAEEAKAISGTYNISVDIISVIIVLICILTFWFVIKFIKNKRPNFLVSICGVVVTLAISFVSYNFIYKNTSIYNNVLSMMQLYHETEIVSCKGLVYSLINSSTVMNYDKPEDYSQEKALEILSRYSEPSAPKNAPNIIAVMGEAYTDIQNWKNVEFTDENPYDFYNFLKETESCYGKIYVPGFAGATACTEFEFLTGENTSAISSSLPTAYKTLITADTYSLARTFKEWGYDTAVMHPGFPWFYNRQNVYSRMGFDKFVSRDDLPTNIDATGAYANDTVLFDMVSKDYDKHLKNNKNGYFNFSITIQNHGSYNSSELVYNKEYIKKSNGLTDEEYYIINNYLGGIKAADDLLKSMYEYLNTIDTPTVMIFFGDHLPFLDSEEKIYEKLGYDITASTFESYKQRYSTDYIIVGNDAFKKSIGAKVVGEQNMISANYLSLKLFEYSKIPFTRYHQFLNDMQKELPLLTRMYNGTVNGGFEHQLSDKANELLKEYKILQYYNIKDYHIDSKGENK